MDCQYCKKSFTNKYLLGQHQSKTKYCLSIQGVSLSNQKEEKYECKYCLKVLCSNERLHTHFETCKEKIRKEYDSQVDKIQKEHSEEKERMKKEYCDQQEKIKNEHDRIVLENEKEIHRLRQIICENKDLLAKMDEKIEKQKIEYEAKLEKFENAVIASATSTTVSKAPITHTTNTTNNITVTNHNNVLNLSKEHVNKVLTEHLNYDVVYAGQAGFAKFVVDKMLKGPDGKLTYKCVDPSRQMFEFTDESGETVRDMRAEKLIQSLLDGDAIKIGLDAAAKGWNTDDRQLNNDRTSTFGPRVTEYTDLNRNNNVFRTKVSSLTT